MILFYDFFKTPVFFYRFLKSSGEPFGEPFKKNGQIYRFIFLTEYLTYLYACILNFIYCLKAYKNRNIEDLLGSLSTLLFACSGLLKEAAFYINYKNMKLLRNQLEELFPKTLEKQLEMNTEKYLKFGNTFIKSFSAFCVVGFSWIIIPITLTTLDFLRTGNFVRILALYNDYPYNWEDSAFLYVFTYSFECFSISFSLIAFMNVDLILCGVLTQCLMHLDYISEKIMNYFPKDIQMEDLSFIFPIIENHNRILSLCEMVNRTFQKAILINMIITSLTLCLILCYICIAGPEVLLQLSLLLGIFVLQLRLICYLGNEISDAVRLFVL